MPAAARVGDMHACPSLTPAPHVGGPIQPCGAPTVLIGNQPAARITDRAQCVGQVDTITQGSPTVFIEHKQAARQGDATCHGGSIVQGEPTVLIGDK